MRKFLELAMRFRSTQILDNEFPRLRHEFDSALTRLLETTPKIVCLCGSTRFGKQYERLNLEFTVAGYIVLSVGWTKESNSELFGDSPSVATVKTKLDELHKRKIDLADEIFVINVGGYIGDSTRSEIAYAEANGKPVRWLESVDVETQLENAAPMATHSSVG